MSAPPRCKGMVADPREGHRGEHSRCELPLNHLGYHRAVDHSTCEVWLGDVGGVHWPDSSLTAKPPRPWWRFW